MQLSLLWSGLMCYDMTWYDVDCERLSDHAYSSLRGQRADYVEGYRAETTLLYTTLPFCCLFCRNHVKEITVQCSAA